jgi:hypothetical protein
VLSFLHPLRCHSHWSVLNWIFFLPCLFWFSWIFSLHWILYLWQLFRKSFSLSSSSFELHFQNLKHFCKDFRFFIQILCPFWILCSFLLSSLAEVPGSKGLWPWYISTNITFLDVMYRLVFIKMSAF